MHDQLEGIVRSTLPSLLIGAAVFIWGCTGPASVKDQAGVVRGTVAYLQPMTLPPDADVVVQLRELSGPGDPPRLVAEQYIESPGRVPVSFELRYDRWQIDATRRYELAAMVLRGERILLMSGRAYPVLTGRYPDPVKIVLQPSR